MKKHSLVLILFVVVVSVVLIATSGLIGRENTTGFSYYKAKVVEVLEDNLSPDSMIPEIKVGFQRVRIEFLQGSLKGQQFEVRNPISRLYNVNTKKGMTIVTSVRMQDGQPAEISVYSYTRDKLIYILVGLLFLALIVVGGMKGLKSILSLVFSGIVIVFFLFPAVFRGGNPIFSAILAACVITVISLLLISGLNKKTASAIAGTIIGVTIAGIFAYLSGKIGHLSGLSTGDADELLYLAEQYKFDISGLLFTGILIASLGAIMDIGISIASSIFEMHSLSTRLSRKELFLSGMNVGKDMIGTMTNTLILAFTGASLNLVIFIIASRMPYTQIINMNMLCSELIQALSGSIALVLTVPITALISVKLITLEPSTPSSKKIKKS